MVRKLTSPSPLLKAGASLCLIGLVAGCGQSGETTIENVGEAPKNNFPENPEMSDSDRLGFRPVDGSGMNAGGASGAATAGTDLYHYSTPEGWQETTPTQFRNPNLVLTSDPAASLYVTTLPGGGGGIEGNINRWMNQLGGGALDTGAIESLPKISLMGGAAPLVEVRGEFAGGMGADPIEDAILYGSLIMVDSTLITVKMIGPAASLEDQLPAFKEFCGSLHSGAGHSHDVASTDDSNDNAGNPGPAGTVREGDSGFRPGGFGDGPIPQGTNRQTPATTSGGAEAGGSDEAALGWKTPEGWEQGEQKSMRVVTYLAGAENSCELSVIPLGGDGGGVKPNFDRWRGQMDMAPMTDDEFAALDTLEVLGTDAPMIDLSGDFKGGMGAEPVDDAQMFGVIAPMQDKTLFIKMVGPAAEMEAQRENFIAYCESMILSQ